MKINDLRRLLIGCIFLGCVVFGYYVYAQKASSVTFDESDLIQSEGTIPMSSEGEMKKWFYNQEEMVGFLKNYKIQYAVKEISPTVDQRFVCVCATRTYESLGPNLRVGVTLFLYKEINRREIPKTVLGLSAIYFADIPSKIKIDDQGSVTIIPLSKK